MLSNRAVAAGEYPNAATPVTLRMIGARIGQLVVTHLLGEGGMGAVYAAEHEILRTRRAIKVLLPEWTQNAMVVQRFVNEARAAASIQHRNIIAIHDCGQLASGSWYIVMDHLAGSTLSRFRTSQAGPLSTHLVLELLASIASGLEAAHATGIVHRDLKPDNIFLIQHGENVRHPIILDFGIAKLGEHDTAGLTRTGMSAGTPAYMAPEQVRDMKLVDRRSDVYALGVIAYELITGGWRPYQDPAERGRYGQLPAAEIYHRQMSREPPPPRQHVASIPDRWAAAIRGAIDSDPSRRPQTPRDFVLALAEATLGAGELPSGMSIVRSHAPELLQPARSSEPVRSSDVGALTSASRPLVASDARGMSVATPVPETEPPDTSLDQGKARSKRHRIFSVLAGVGAGGLLAFAISSSLGQPTTSPPSVTAREPDLARPLLSTPAFEPSPSPSAAPASDPASRVAPPAVTPEAIVPAPGNSEPSTLAPGKREAIALAPGKPSLEAAPRQLPPVPVARPQPSAPRESTRTAPEPAGTAAALPLTREPVTGADLDRKWRAVLSEIKALQKSKGPGATDPLFARWRRINILSAMSTPESRTNAVRELAEIRKALAAL